MNLESMALPKKREVFGPVSYQLAPGGIVGLHTILRQEAFDSGFVAVTTSYVGNLKNLARRHFRVRAVGTGP